MMTLKERYAETLRLRIAVIKAMLKMIKWHRRARRIGGAAGRK